MKKINLFLDSGAYSAWSKGVTIDIDEYISFIKKNIKYITVYANLDVIGDPEATYRNQKYMESKGLRPLPVFHSTLEPYSWLKKYIDEEYEYIGLGGMAGGSISKKDIVPILDEVFEKYICDKDGMPKVKVHGFGMTSLELLLKYPWYSVDSTSWVMTGRFGSVMVPRFRNGKYVYDEQPWKVTVSLKSPDIKEQDKHILTYTEMERKVIMEYFKKKGYVLGKSEYRSVDRDYKLKEGERWFGKEEADSQRSIYGTDNREGYVRDGWSDDRLVETIIEPGICNDYKLRDELNIAYYLDLQESLPKWQWSFKKESLQKKFGLRK
jgi:hypothetical protein